MNPIFIVLLSALIVISVNSFQARPNINIKSKLTGLKSLSKDVLDKLEDIRTKYDLLENLDSPDADQERAQLEEVAQKYKSYREVRVMLSKLKQMLKTEMSENRKEKQLNSFISLYKGKIELEEVLKEKLGLPFSKDPAPLKSLIELEVIDKEISTLKSKLQGTSISIPAGKSTRAERFLN